MKQIISLLTLFCLTCGLSAQNLAPAIADATDNGNGTFTNWFGTWAPETGELSNRDWIDHAEHGRIHISAFGQNLWIYDPNIAAVGAGINGWVFTNRSLFPYFYVRGAGPWLTYVPGVSGPDATPRIFVDARNGATVLLPKVTTDTIVDIAVGNEAFAALVAAVTKAELGDALAANGPLTVFAPVNSAFDAAAQAILENENATAGDLVNALDKDALAGVLAYHVVEGRFTSGDLGLDLGAILRGEYINGYVTTLSGIDLRVDTTPFGILLNGTTMVTTPDVAAGNGIIHIIDEVLLPPQDIYDTAANNPAFSYLVAAVDKAGLEGALRGPDPQLTVFAPTNDAFDAAAKVLLNDVNATGPDLVAALDPAALAEVLTYHVVPAKVYASEVEPGTVPTLNPGGATAVISVSESGLMIDGANIIATDVQASNGVIHVIDAVILPTPPLN